MGIRFNFGKPMLRRYLLYALLAMPLFTACSQVFAPYQHVILESDPQVKVTERAKATPGWPPHWFKDTIATRGEIVREAYTLLLEADPASLGAILHVSFFPRIGQRIDPRPYNDQGNCTHWSPQDGGRPPDGRAKWRAGFICSARDGDTTMKLHFDVTDRQGNVQGTESIKLTVVADGYIIIFEGI
jgi:hypothetical protein